MADSGVTLIVRFVNKEKWYEGHSCHAYQNAARRWGSHERVVVWMLLVNLIWLAPLSWLSFLYPENGFYICFVALTTLVIFVRNIKRGALVIAEFRDIFDIIVDGQNFVFAG